jgi:hypothetical protein
MTKFDSWAKWIDEIRPDLQQLRVNRHIFAETAAIIAANPAIQQSSSFYQWLASNHHAQIAMCLRRHADDGRGNRSFRRLLMDMRSDSRCLSRVACANVWGENMRGYGEAEFDRIVGTGHSYVPQNLLDQDLRVLDDALQKAEDYASSRVAHLGAEPAQPPTMRELEDAASVLESMYQKYKMLLTASVPDLLPVWQYDWKRVLRHAWIPPA